MIQVLIHRPLTTEGGTRFPFNPRGIRGVLSYSGIGFSPTTSVFLWKPHFIVTHPFLRLRSMIYNHSNQQLLEIKHFSPSATSTTVLCIMEMSLSNSLSLSLSLSLDIVKISTDFVRYSVSYATVITSQNTHRISSVVWTTIVIQNLVVLFVQEALNFMMICNVSN